jgi:hypothetical protein
METFRIRASFRFREIIGCLFPALMILAPIGIWLFVIMPSGGMFEFKSSLFVILIILAGFIWLYFEIKKVIKVLAFRVIISEQFIRIGETEKSWNDIAKAEFKQAIFMKPAIILYGSQGERLEIPAVIEGFPYIRTSIERHVATVSK